MPDLDAEARGRLTAVFEQSTDATWTDAEAAGFDTLTAVLDKVSEWETGVDGPNQVGKVFADSVRQVIAEKLNGHGTTNEQRPPVALPSVPALPWTRLRHRMLRAIADGQVQTGDPASQWTITSADSTAYHYQARAVSSLVDAEYARALRPTRTSGPVPLRLTPAGRFTLAAWGLEHGEYGLGEA